MGYGGVLKYMSRTLDFCTRLITIWRARAGLLGETGAAPSQALQGPSTSSPGNQRKLRIEKCQETIGQCLIRHWPILLDAIMLGFLPLSSTLLAFFYSPSVSHQPPPVHSGRASSQRGPRSRPHPGPQRPGFARGLRPLNPRLSETTAYEPVSPIRSLSPEGSGISALFHFLSTSSDYNPRQN